MMYSVTELENVKKQLLQTIILISAIFLAVLIPSVAFLLRMPTWIGTMVMTVGVFICIFLWGIYGTPTFHYYRYLKDILEGRTREISGKVVKVEDKPVYKDNRLLYYEVWIIDDEDGEERILLFDDNKGKPSVKPGVHYTFRIHESFITEITEA